MNNANQTLYESINVNSAASQAEIEKACLQMGEKYRPDKHLGDSNAALIFTGFEEAYATLTDPVKLAAYDAELSRQRAKSIEMKNACRTVYPDDVLQEIARELTILNTLC